MRRLGSLMRVNALSSVENLLLSITTCEDLRKKKKLVNIFKDRQDPQPMPITEYPIYVQELARQSISIHEMLYGIEQNINHLEKPSRASYKSFMKGLKRQRCKRTREFKQDDRIPLQDSEKFDYMNRIAIYQVFTKSQEEIEEDEKKREEEEMEEDDD